MNRRSQLSTKKMGCELTVITWTDRSWCYDRMQFSRNCTVLLLVEPLGSDSGRKQIPREEGGNLEQVYRDAFHCCCTSLQEFAIQGLP